LDLGIKFKINKRSSLDFFERNLFHFILAKKPNEMRIVFLALIFTASLSFGQKSPIKFGDISMEDMKMTVYDKDSSAAAVVLTDFGKAYVNISSIASSLNFERHVRIKILRKQGFRVADIGIPLFHIGLSDQIVTNFKASTYNIENKKIVETKVDKEGMFKEKFNRYLDLQKFTFPNIKEGSIMEYSYTVTSKALASFPNWEFQRDIPVRHSEYWAIVPEFFVMEKYMQGYLVSTSYEEKSQPQSSYSEKAYHWIIKDAPAFEAEPLMTSTEDYISKINFALAVINFPNRPSIEVMGSWDKLKTDLLEAPGFTKVITGSNFLKKITEEVISGKTDPFQKAKAIHEYVKKTMEWDGTKDKYTDNLKKAFELKKGTAADINLMLASMLEKADIAVDMVLLSTKSHGFIRKQYPMERQFDYVVCAIKMNGRVYFLDATEKYMPMGILPERCLNGEGLIVSSKNWGWINLDSKTKSKTVYSADLAMSSTGELKGKLNISRDGYNAMQMRKDYHLKGEQEYLKSNLNSSNWTVTNSEFQNIEPLDVAPKEIHDLQIIEHASIAQDVIYVNPFITSQIVKNPFSLEERKYPVDFGSPQEIFYTCRITIPEDYIIDELPQRKAITLPNNAGRYLYDITQMGNYLNVTRNFLINQALFIQDEYPALREFYRQVVAKEAEQIVLKKK
jgi:hypothetical protein